MTKTKPDPELEAKKRKVQVTLLVLKSIIDTIREFKEVPCSTIYASLQTQGCTYEQFIGLEKILLETKLVKKESNQYIWVEPPPEKMNRGDKL